MARLVVLANPGLADGFRLAGCATLTAGTSDATVVLRGLVTQDDVGVILVTADLWEGVDEKLRAAVERLARPIVLPIPAGTVTDATTRRQLLGEMLERAIGYRVELASGAGP